VVTVGQEVGLFYHWDDVAARIDNVSGNVHKKYKSFDQALQVYTRNYQLGRLRPTPVPGGPFWISRSPSSASPTLSSPSDSDLWSELEDLSDVFSQVTID